MGDEFYKTVFSASQSPLGKTGHVTFEKDCSYIMQCFVVSCEGRGRDFSALPPPCSFCIISKTYTLSNFYYFLYPHIITVFLFLSKLCLLNKVFIDIHCLLSSTIKSMASITLTCVCIFSFMFLLDKCVLLKRCVLSGKSHGVLNPSY